MRFIHDTRDCVGKHQNVLSYLEANGHTIVRSKLFVGDVSLLHDQTTCIDLKKDLQECAGNLCQQHERFRAECTRAKDAEIRLVILVQHSASIKSIDDVRGWVNPRLRTSPKAVTGGRLAAIMETMADKYGVEWAFCSKSETGRVICEILGVDVSNGSVQ